MEQFTFSKYSKFVVISLIILLIYISYKIIQPFITPILGAGVVAIAAYPLYKKIYYKTKKKSLSSILVILFILIFIIIPLMLFANRLLSETINVYNAATKLDATDFSNKLKDLTGIDIDYGAQIREFLRTTSTMLIHSTSDMVRYFIKGVVQLFIFFFTLFFLLKDGKSTVKRLRDVFPIREDIEKKLFREIEKVIKGLITGVLLVAVIEGIVAFMGFYLFGIPNPLLWSFVIVLAAYLPIIGPATVYVPATLYLIVIGNVTEGILLFIYSFGLISYLDNIVKPQVMGKGSNINPIVVLLGVLGGINLFGIPGIVVGPLILSVLFVIYRLYEEENATQS